MPHIPIFPLQMVAYPGEKVPLHIFEPRYRRLMAECERTGDCFGIVPVHDRSVAHVGCGMRIEEVVERYPDGRLDVITRGDQPFRIRQLLLEEDAEFAHRAEVDFWQVDPTPELLRQEQLLSLYVRFHELIDSGHEMEVDLSRAVSYQLGHTSGLDLPGQIQLLALATEPDRQDMLIEHFQRILPAVESVERTRSKIRQNGHFRILPAADFDVNPSGFNT